MKKLILFITVCFITVTFANAQWQQTNGPFGGTINCINISDDDIYVGTTTGLYHSKNNGQSWDLIDIGDSNPNVLALITDSSYIYVTTYDSGGVYISKDYGKNWTKKLFASVTSFAKNGNCIYAGTFWSGILVSKDHGDNWVHINNGLPTAYSKVYSIAIDDNKLFAGTDSGMYYSENNGLSWIQRKSGTCNPVKTILLKDSIVYVGTDGCGVFKSSDEGKNWTPMNMGISGFVNVLVMDDTNLIAGTTSGIYISNNDDYSWTNYNEGMTLFPQVLSLNLTANYIYAGTKNGGLFLSDDHGQKWSEVNNIFTYARVNSIATNGQEIYAGTRYNGIYSSDNEGTTWEPINNGLNFNGSVKNVVAKDKYIFAQTELSGIYYSEDSGKHWSKDSVYKNVAIFTLAIDDTNLFAGTSVGIFLSRNWGTTWTKISDITGITTIVANGTNIIAGHNNLYLSIDYGITWSQLKNCPVKNFSSILYDGTNIIAGTKSKGVYISNDNGTTWSAINNGLLDSNVTCLTRKGDSIFAGTYFKGVYLTKNNGKSWGALNNNLTDLKIVSLKIIGNNLYAGTIKGGLWKLSFSDTVGIFENPKNTLKIYPNPATNMLYVELPEYKKTTIEILDITGQVLQSIFVNSLNITLDISCFQKGVYILKVFNNNSIITGKFIKN